MHKERDRIRPYLRLIVPFINSNLISTHEVKLMQGQHNVNDNSRTSLSWKP